MTNASRFVPFMFSTIAVVSPASEADGIGQFAKQLGPFVRSVETFRVRGQTAAEMVKDFGARVCGIPSDRLQVEHFPNELVESGHFRLGLWRVVDVVGRILDHSPLAQEKQSTVWNIFRGLLNRNAQFGYGGIRGSSVLIVDTEMKRIHELRLS